MNNFFNEEELQNLILLYRTNLEKIRENHDNLLSMMVAVVTHVGGEVRIPYAELQELGEGTPFTIKMTPDEQGENMIITVEKVDDGDDVSDLPGGPDGSPGEGGSTKLHA